MEKFEYKQEEIKSKKPDIKELFKNVNKKPKYEKYTDKLKKEGLSEKTENLILDGCLKILKNKIVVINGKKIKFNEEFIYLNIEKFEKNIKNFLIFLMNIESFGGKNVENKHSSAKGPLQWIDGWKNGKKAKKFNRKLGKTSPFETALRRAEKYYTGNKYPDFSSKKIPKHIIDAWNNGGKLDLKNFDQEKQIQLWIIDILMRPGKAREYLMGIMVGNTWSAKKLYENIHHTNVEKGSDSKTNVNRNFMKLALN